MYDNTYIFLIQNKLEKRGKRHLKYNLLHKLFLHLGAVHVRQADPVRWTRSPRWNYFYPTFIWNLVSHFNQKVSYVTGKRLF